MTAKPTRLRPAPAKRARAAKVEKTPTAVSEASHSLGVFALIDTKIIYGKFGADDGEIEYRYDAEMDHPDRVGEDGALWLVATRLSVKKQREGEDQSAIRATYVFGINCENVTEDKVIDIAKRYVATAVWQAFASLSAIMAQQMRVDFPGLPSEPSEIEVKDLFK
ncbi:hypothetical protein [Ensifer sp. MJa1]|uniref:hypothetical protein n=1 Tax=Ensifer sp. MJa1 TaxID=2919888 RepID=UPI00300A2D52